MLHITRQRRFKHQFALGNGMDEAEHGCMQCLTIDYTHDALEPTARWADGVQLPAAICFVPQHGMADVLRVNTYLMRASGFKAENHYGKIGRASCRERV